MPDQGTMPASDSQEPADLSLLQLALPRSQKVVLVIDLVESVRLMSADEAGTVARWHRFVQQAKDHTIPLHHGRLVKSLGDGLMVEFELARDAVNAAQTLHNAIAHTNAGQSAERHMHLRAGINSSQIYTDQLDIYGAGVNLAARLATLAGPGETVVSASVRDGLTDGLDASVEDLGECYLKHIDEPVRAYRAGGVGAAPVVYQSKDYSADLCPAVAVIPFEARNTSSDTLVVGDLLADAVIGQLGKMIELRVISRLSTSAFRGRATSIASMKQQLAVNYVVSGSYTLDGQKLVISCELSDAFSEHIIWTDRLTGSVSDLLQAQSEIGQQISSSVCAAILKQEVQKATQQPLPTLQSYTLMLGAITLMHRATHSDFKRAKIMLERLHELHRRHAQPLAWLGKWYILQLAQGWSVDGARDATDALSFCDKALEIDGQSSLAIAVTGQVHGYIKREVATAERMYHDALAINPNEPMAWLWLGMSLGFRGAGEEAIQASERALALSPLDPLRYYYQSLAASTATCAGRYDRAIELAGLSIRINRTHASTYRALAIAQALSGREADAQKTIAQLLTLDPTSTVQRFIERYPAANEAPDQMKLLAHALRVAGLPS